MEWVDWYMAGYDSERSRDRARVKKGIKNLIRQVEHPLKQRIERLEVENESLRKSTSLPSGAIAIRTEVALHLPEVVASLRYAADSNTWASEAETWLRRVRKGLRAAEALKKAIAPAREAGCP